MAKNVNTLKNISAQSEAEERRCQQQKLSKGPLYNNGHKVKAECRHNCRSFVNGKAQHDPQQFDELNSG